MEEHTQIATTTKIKNVIKNTIYSEGKQKLPRPDCVYSLRASILAQKPPPKCNCDICDPHFYRVHWNCKIHPHQHPKLKFSPEKNKFGNACYQPLKLNSLLRGEAMEIARTAIAYFGRPVEQLNNTQIAAVDVLRTWIRSNMALFFTGYQPPVPDLSTLLPAVVVRELWKYFSILFFGAEIPSPFHFVWNADLKTSQDVHLLGIADKGWRKHTIEINPLYHNHHA
jgi:hypothetical protein